MQTELENLSKQELITYIRQQARLNKQHEKTHRQLEQEAFRLQQEIASKGARRVS